MSTLQPRLCPRCIRPCHGAPMRSCAVSARCGCYRTVRLRSCALRHPHGATTIAVGRCERALEIMVGRFHRALQPRGDETLAAMGLTTAPALPPAADPRPHTADNCGSISPPHSLARCSNFRKKKLETEKSPRFFRERPETLQCRKGLFSIGGNQLPGRKFRPPFGTNCPVQKFSLTNVVFGIPVNTTIWIRIPFLRWGSRERARGPFTELVNLHKCHILMFMVQMSTSERILSQ